VRERERDRKREREREKERFKFRDLLVQRNEKTPMQQLKIKVFFKTETPGECKRFKKKEKKCDKCLRVCVGRGKQEKTAVMILGCFLKTHVLLRR
jgi:hypothetical protein